MADGDQPPPSKRVKLAFDDVARMTKDELVQRVMDQEAQIDALTGEGNENILADQQEKFRQLQQDAARRENVLVMRLTAKDQELQELVAQNEEMKRAQNLSTSQLRGMLLDPAINLIFQRMKKEMEQSKEKLEQAQNDLAAWKFTPDGQTGKRLMAKCRLLLQENSELGKVIAAGRTAKLEGEIALGKKFVEEMKQSQAETEEFLTEMDDDVEGLQTTIYLLQQELKEAKEQNAQLLQQQAQALQQGRTSRTEDKYDAEGRTEGQEIGRQTTRNGNNSNHHGGEMDRDQDMEDEEESERMDISEQFSSKEGIERTSTVDSKAGKLCAVNIDSAAPLHNGTLEGGNNGSSNGNVSDDV